MTSNFSFHQDFNSDDEEQSEYKQSGRDATLIVIDCKKSMFEEIEDEGSSLFIKCLSVLERYLLNKIIHSSKGLVNIKKIISSNAELKKSDCENYIITIYFSSVSYCTMSKSRRNQKEIL